MASMYRSAFNWQAIPKRRVERLDILAEKNAAAQCFEKEPTLPNHDDSTLHFDPVTRE